MLKPFQSLPDGIVLKKISMKRANNETSGVTNFKYLFIFI